MPCDGGDHGPKRGRQLFASIQDVMGFRRASSRLDRTIQAEVLLKVLANNISRLAARRPLAVICLSWEVFPSSL